MRGMPPRPMLPSPTDIPPPCCGGCCGVPCPGPCGCVMALPPERRAYGKPWRASLLVRRSPRPHQILLLHLVDAELAGAIAHGLQDRVGRGQLALDPSEGID